jgi:hypothetical protein
MAVLFGPYLPCNSAEREHGIRGGIVEVKIRRVPSQIAGVFDRDRMGGRILSIQESGDAKHPVAVRASGIAAEGNGEQLEDSFLPPKVEAIDMPKHLILTRRCGQNCGGSRDGIGGPERSDSGRPVHVDIYIEMTDAGEAFFGAFAAARAKRIGSDVDVRPGGVLMCEPSEVSRGERRFQ